MISTRRLPRALALACCTTALIPAAASARPALDAPPAHAGPDAAVAGTGTPLPGSDDAGAAASDSDAAAIATAAGGALLVAGIAAQITRRRRRAAHEVAGPSHPPTR